MVVDDVKWGECEELQVKETEEALIKEINRLEAWYCAMMNYASLIEFSSNCEPLRWDDMRTMMSVAGFNFRSIRKEGHTHRRKSNFFSKGAPATTRGALFFGPFS